LFTVDIREAFLNAEFTPADSPIYLKINKDVVPYWVKQDPNALPYVSSTGFTLAARSSMQATDNPLMTSAYFIKGQRQDLATFQHILMTYCYVAAARLLRKSSGVL
jgi:hypothetical protein